MITKEWLHREYVTKQRRVVEIAEEAGVSAATVYNKFKIYGIYRRRNYKNIIGDRFGKWTVLSLSESNKHGTIWCCKCDCGYESKIHRHSLSCGKSTQCKKCADESKICKDEFTQSFFTKIVLGAKRRGIDLSVNKDYLYNLYLSQDRSCALSGMSITFSKTDRDHSHGKSTASLDRIDSKVGYHKGNVQWVHKDINRMKQRFTNDELVDLCKKIVKHNKRS